MNKLLSNDGRLIFVNSVLFTLPTFYLCTLKIPPGVVDQVDRYMKHFLWDRGELNKKGGCLVAWKDACRSKEQGGLGIIDVKTQNTALLMNFLHKSYNHVNIPWVALTRKCLYANDTVPHMKRPIGSFWWRDVMSLKSTYLSIASCKFNVGNTCSFWTDLWDLGILQHTLPQLFSFAKKEKISVKIHRTFIVISSHHCV